MGRFDGRVAVITGSARGMGKQMALRFAREGADIVLNDLREEQLKAAAQEIKALGRKAVYVVADISTADGAKKLIDAAVNSFGKVDILVNNAGIVARGTLLETTEEEWNSVLAVDLKGVFLCTQAAAKHMIEKKYGKIINIASVAGIGSIAGPLAYAAAKAGVVQMTKTCARELGRYNINVNCIAPGRIITDMTYIGRTPEEVEKSIEAAKKASALKRAGSPDDVANVALFLASDESSFVSGQVIPCDGGRMDRM
ncbi:MAG: glucose 1-dehydrogenase [Dehalococcoidales bacterium]|nr:glucose 1-dehydrogenase [Dehalococcoidales bacterium]